MFKEEEKLKVVEEDKLMYKLFEWEKLFLQERNK